MTGDGLRSSARRLMVRAICPECSATVAEIRDSAEGPLLLLEHPTDDAPGLLRMTRSLRDLGGSHAVRVVVTDDHGDHRPLRPGERVPYPPKAPGVRLLEPDDWTAQVLHCGRHGWSSIARDDLLAAIERFRSSGHVVGIKATITHIA